MKPSAPPVVTLIGAGPGDPELLTVKAVKALRRATVALVDDLVRPGVLRYLRRGARVVHVGKRGGLPGHTPAAVVCGAHTPAQREAVCTLATLADVVQQQGMASPAILVVGDVVQASPMWSSIGNPMGRQFQASAIA